MPAQTDLTDVFAVLRAWVQANYPGRLARRLCVELDDGEKVKLPLPLCGAADRAAVASFEPTPFQVGILDALAGKALRVEQIIAVVKDKPKFYRDPGGIKELERHGLVRHDKRHGYFRPDALPEDLEDPDG